MERLTRAFNKAYWAIEPTLIKAESWLEKSKNNAPQGVKLAARDILLTYQAAYLNYGAVGLGVATIGTAAAIAKSKVIIKPIDGGVLNTIDIIEHRNKIEKAMVSKKAVAKSVKRHQKKVAKKVDKILKLSCDLSIRKSDNSVIELNSERLPIIKLPENVEGKLVSNTANKDIFFTQKQFEQFLKIVKKEFKKYEVDYNINVSTEVGRVTYEAFVRTTKKVNGKVINGWRVSTLAVTAGNFSGIKCFNPKKQAFVIKYDDGVNPIDKQGNSRFILFQRNDFYDIENWCRYQCTVVLANKNYYKPTTRNRHNIDSYASNFKSYATHSDYCKVLASRGKLVEKWGI